MKSTVKELSKTEVEIEVEIPSEEFNQFIEKAILNMGKDLEVEGFRKGKAPKEIIKEKIGHENIMIEAADSAIKANYGKALLENKVEAISQPEINILKLAPNNPLIFKAKTTILPKIDLPDYRKIVKKVERKEASVEESEVENGLKWLQKSRSKLTLKNGPAQKGDFVEIEYSCPQIRELGENKKDAFILGEGHFIPGFEDKLVGLEAKDEEIQFSLTLPENYSIKNLTGKQADFKLKVKSVQKVELPELNDQFAKDLGKFESLEALKKNIREGLASEKKQAESQRIRNEILEKISQASSFEIPEILVKREQEALMENFKQEISTKLNIPFKDYLEKIKKTEQEILDSLLEQAKKRVKSFLILKAIGEKENIEVSDEEVRNQANEILKSNPAPEKTAKDIDLEKIKEYSKGLIKNEKIFKLLENL